MRKLLLVSILVLFVLGITTVVFADESTTSTSSDPSQATNQEQLAATEQNEAVTEDVYKEKETVAKEVYGVQEGYIVSITDSQLVVGKGKYLTLTLSIDSATKFYKTVGKNKSATISDFKAGQKILARFTKDKKAVVVRMLPGKTPKEIIARVKAKAAEAAKIAKQKAQKAKLEVAKQKVKAAEAKIKVKKEKIKDKLTTVKEKIKEKNEKIKEIKQTAKSEKKANKQK